MAKDVKDSVNTVKVQVSVHTFRQDFCLSLRLHLFGEISVIY